MAIEILSDLKSFLSENLNPKLPRALRRSYMAKKNESYSIRTMNREEINIAVDWAAAEGWNPGLYDADCFYTADPSGFLIGKLNGEPIATISVVKYGRSFGFLGFYIVNPEYRGKGYGLSIWKAGLKHLKGRNIGLDGVVAQQDNYKKSGFTFAYRNIRYEGVGGGEHHENLEIKKLSEIPFEAVYAYDKPFFPDERGQFLQCWINMPEATALAIMQDGNLAGYGVIRTCRQGYKIGPLLADTPGLAEALFLTLKASATQGAPVFLDIPELNQAAVSLAERYGMKVAFETARMYRGNFPDLPINRLFGVTTFELG